MKEIDLILDYNGMVYPIEIKKTASPSKDDAHNFRLVRSIPGKTCGNGIVICPVERIGILQPGIYTVPLTAV